MTSWACRVLSSGLAEAAGEGALSSVSIGIHVSELSDRYWFESCSATDCVPLGISTFGARVCWKRANNLPREKETTQAKCTVPDPREGFLNNSKVFGGAAP